MAILDSDPDGNESDDSWRDAFDTTTGTDSGGSALPDWLAGLKSVSGTLVRFASNPYAFIKTEVMTMIVVAVLTAIEVTTGYIRDLWGVVEDAIAAGGESITFSLASAGTAIEDAARIVPDLLELLADPSGPLGPAAPVIIGLAGIGVVYVAYEAAKRTPGVLWKLYQVIPGT